MGEPDIPPGFDFTDPTSTRTGCPPRSSPSCAAPPRSGGSPQPRGAAGFDDEGVLGGHQARRRDGDLQAQRPVLLRGEHRDHPVTAGHDPRVARDAAAHPAQHRPAAAHQAARHRLPRLHPAGHRQPARGADRTRRAIVQTALDSRHRRLRRRRGLRAAAAGHRRAARHPAGGPGQDLRLVQPDDRLRRPGSGRATARSAAAELLGYAWPWPRTARRARATTSSPSWSAPRSTGTSCPPTSSASS